jgi:hypothetical protein
MKKKWLFAVMTGLLFIAVGCEKAPEFQGLSQRVEIVGEVVVYTLDGGTYSRKQFILFGYGFYDHVREEWRYSKAEEARDFYKVLKYDLKYNDEPNDIVTKIDYKSGSKLITIEFRAEFYMNKWGGSTAQEVKDEIQTVIDRGEIWGMPSADGEDEDETDPSN